MPFKKLGSRKKISQRILSIYFPTRYSRTNGYILLRRKEWDIIDDHFHFDNTIPAIEKRFVSRELEQFPQHCSLSSAIYILPCWSPTCHPLPSSRTSDTFRNDSPLFPGGGLRRSSKFRYIRVNQVRRRFLGGAIIFPARPTFLRHVIPQKIYNRKVADK